MLRSPAYSRYAFIWCLVSLSLIGCSKKSPNEPGTPNGESPTEGSWMLDSIPDLASSGWDLTGVAFSSDVDGWAVGADWANGTGVLLQCNQGVWSVVEPPTLPTPWHLVDVSCTSASEAWAVGQVTSNEGWTGLVLHFQGGAWEQVVLPDVGSSWWSLKSVSFLPGGEGWAAGGVSNLNGVMLHWDGATWSSMQLPSFSSPSGDQNWTLNDVCFSSPDRGWAVGTNALAAPGWSGFVLEYSGGSWGKSTIPAIQGSGSLTSVEFIGETEGWAVGPSPTVLRYQEGEWTQHIPAIGEASKGITATSFVSTFEGWAVGTSENILYHYSNGGWEVTASDVGAYEYDLLAVDFPSKTKGWAVGNWDYTRGAIFKFVAGASSFELAGTWHGTFEDESITIDITSTRWTFDIGSSYHTHGDVQTSTLTRDSCVLQWGPEDMDPGMYSKITWTQSSERTLTIWIYDVYDTIDEANQSTSIDAGPIDLTKAD